MKVPELEKRYKVFWTYYVSTINTHHKTFEHLNRQQALAWVKKLMAHAITASVHITDYEGNFKRWEMETTTEVLRKRERFFDKLREDFGGGEEGQQKAVKFLKNQGDWALTALPVQVRAFILSMRKKKHQERQATLFEEGR